MCLSRLRKMNSEDRQVYSVCILQLSCFTKYNRVQSKLNKQNVNIADETLTDYSFLSRYHYTKLKNYLKRRDRIRQSSLNSHVYWDTLYEDILNVFPRLIVSNINCFKF